MTLLIGAQDAVDAVRDALVEHLPAVLPLFAEAYGVELPVPATIDLLASLDAASSVQTPAFAVAESGSSLAMQEQNRYGGDFSVTVRVLSRGEDYEQTSAISRLYGAAVIRALAWNRTLGGRVERVIDFADGPGPIDSVAVRTLAARDIDMTVRIRDVLDLTDGPGSSFPIAVTSTDITVTRED